MPTESNAEFFGRLEGLVNEWMERCTSAEVVGALEIMKWRVTRLSVDGPVEKP